MYITFFVLKMIAFLMKDDLGLQNTLPLDLVPVATQPLIQFNTIPTHIEQWEENAKFSPYAAVACCSKRVVVISARVVAARLRACVP